MARELIDWIRNSNLICKKIPSKVLTPIFNGQDKGNFIFHNVQIYGYNTLFWNEIKGPENIFSIPQKCLTKFCFCFFSGFSSLSHVELGEFLRHVSQLMNGSLSH